MPLFALYIAYDSSFRLLASIARRLHFEGFFFDGTHTCRPFMRDVLRAQ